MYLLADTDEYQFRGHEIPYVLNLLLIPTGLAVITSDQNLSFFDPLRLRDGPKGSFATPHGSITAMEVLDAQGCTIATTGENRKISLWDFRATSRGARLDVQTAANASIISLACTQGHIVAAGTEYADYQASILVYDIRAPASPMVQYNEVHSDDITELSFHPSNAGILLSGATDGLVNICDTRVPDEDEVVIQTFNHGSVHHAGFLSNTEIFALSHDEKFALYDMAEEQEKGSAMLDFGDFRNVFGCQYVANVSPKHLQAGAVIGAGSQDQQMFQLIHLAKDANAKWSLNKDSVVGLPGAHSSEIVRSFCFLDEQKVIYTGGEDGQIKAWRPS